MYKTILVHVDGSARASQRIDIAARLAMLHEAHLVGTALTGLSPFMMPVGALEPGVPPIVFPVEALRADADRALDAFDALARRAGVHSFERRRVEEEAGIGVSMQARYCDLVVIGQNDPAAIAQRLRSDFPEYVLLNCARPVLVVPLAAIKDELGKRITVAWNGSNEAVRAITSAIPMLQRAEQVNVVVFNADREGNLHGEDPGADIGLYLARHGIRIDVTAVDGSPDVGAALLSKASDSGSDLIVMGAYGHSRMREFLLGGVTRTALRSAPIPLWMAH